MKLVKRFEGRRLDKELLRIRKKRKLKKIKHEWHPLLAPDPIIERIIYNETHIS
jgi:hypothetical protein